ncbi:hypothetical protein [Pseudofulvibacter geojedonensis]|uniref:Uncharacterized protein n=1 Tax=Pseudofulvibacter geojedonensis TaxID=1123758 RepID=A0ABW3HZP1_9FLAO
MKSLFSILFIITMLTSPVLEKLSCVYETETTELTDIDSDSEVEEENIELESKILDVTFSIIHIGSQKIVVFDFLHIQNFINNHSREINTPPPELT